jgi:glycosyltransferase involved in cell wall biosynthesis
MNILYVSYDGMTDPLGQSQVLPYLFRLSMQGFRFTILSCEKEDNYRRHGENIAYLLKEHSIDWIPVPYTKKPAVLSTVWDIRKLKKLALSSHEEKSFEIVHCRSYIAAFAGIYLKKKAGCRFLFDMRGFWPDERVEGGLWNQRNPVYNVIYRYFRKKERDFLSAADYTVCLTEKAKTNIMSRANLSPAKPLRVEVIPCCADTGHFKREGISFEQVELHRNRLKIHRNDFVLAYLGAIGTWYMLPEMLAFFRLLMLKKPEARFLFITPEPKSTIFREAGRQGIPENRIIVTHATREELPAVLSLADLGIYFIRPSYSKQASSPTKLGELMSMGIPVISNRGVGDTENIIQHSHAGILISGFSDAGYQEVTNNLEDLLKVDRQRIRKAAEEHFSLEMGVEKYAGVYSQLKTAVTRGDTVRS